MKENSPGKKIKKGKEKARTVSKQRGTESNTHKQPAVKTDGKDGGTAASVMDDQ